MMSGPRGGFVLRLMRPMGNVPRDLPVLVLRRLRQMASALEAQPGSPYRVGVTVRDEEIIAPRVPATDDASAGTGWHGTSARCIFAPCQTLPSASSFLCRT